MNFTEIATCRKSVKHTKHWCHSTDPIHK